MMTCLPLKTGDVFLHPGRTCELPEDVDVVATLAAKGLLEPVAVDAPAVADKPGRKIKSA
jgi:hypothetical protein